MTRHKILVSAWEDATDARESGCSLRRVEFLKQLLLAESVEESRIELDPQRSRFGEAGHKRRRRAQICMYPMVPRLKGDGQLYLTCDEVTALATALDVVLFPQDDCTADKKKILARSTTTDWLRIVGYESLEEWADSGTGHPLYGGRQR